jgi:hypothetical protein
MQPYGMGAHHSTPTAAAHRITSSVWHAQSPHQTSTSLFHHTHSLIFIQATSLHNASTVEASQHLAANITHVGHPLIFIICSTESQSEVAQHNSHNMMHEVTKVTRASLQPTSHHSTSRHSTHTSHQSL